jgi:hypothetical protein
MFKLWLALGSWIKECNCTCEACDRLRTACEEFRRENPHGTEVEVTPLRRAIDRLHHLVM